MTLYEWATVAVSALGLIGGAIGFFRSIVAGRRANEAASRAADAQSDAVAALRTSARAEQRIAAALETIARHSAGPAPRRAGARVDAPIGSGEHGPEGAGLGSAGTAGTDLAGTDLAGELLALIPAREVRWNLERRLEPGNLRLRNVGTVEATAVTVGGPGVQIGAPVVIGPQSVLLLRATRDTTVVDVTWRDAESDDDHRATVTVD